MLAALQSDLCDIIIAKSTSFIHIYLIYIFYPFTFNFSVKEINHSLAFSLPETWLTVALWYSPQLAAAT